jgi:hypothetical protein
MNKKKKDEKKKRKRENDGHDDARCKCPELGNTFCLLPFDICTPKQVNSIK